MPASASIGRSAAGHVLRGGEHLDLAGVPPGGDARHRDLLAHLGAGSPRIDVRAQAGDQLSHATPALATGASAFAAVGEEALVADRARRDILHLGHTRRQQPVAGDRLQVDPPVAGPGGRGPNPMGPRERRVDLLADLVAARPRAGADDRDDLIRTAQLPDRANALLEDPRREPAPAGVHGRHGAVGSRARQAGSRP